MKKYVLPLALILLFGAYVVYLKVGNPKPAALPAAAPEAGANPPSPEAPSPAPTPKAAFKDGSFTGNAADAFYGPLQVRALIKDGKIVDVQFLQYPNDRETSIRISNEAMPRLKSEAIQAQSAQVDIVSGATQTSQAFQESLANALALAKD